MHVLQPAPTQFPIWSSLLPGRVDQLFRPLLPQVVARAAPRPQPVFGGSVVCVCVHVCWRSGEIGSEETCVILSVTIIWRFSLPHFPVQGYVVLIFPVKICLGPSNTQVSISG